MKKFILVIVLGFALLFSSCSLKQALTEQYTMFIMGFPQLNYPIVIDSAIYMNMIRKDFRKIDTFYYSLLYDENRDTNTVYFYLGKYDMGSNYEGILYSKIKKQSQDTIVNVYMMVSSFDSLSYKIPLTHFEKQRDTIYIENLIVHNDEFDIFSKKYIDDKLIYQNKLNLKLHQNKKSKLFRIDTIKNNASEL